MFVLKKLFKAIVLTLRFLTTTFLFFYLAQTAFAQVEITEIMYDLEGNDTRSKISREWVEIYNSGPDDINLAKWWFVEVEIGSENEKRHTFLPYPENGDVVIRSNSYAVIVVKPETFLIDWSGFSGKILDSLFSLRQKNDIGEKLVIRDQDENEIDFVTYDPLWGADGDGNSLQKVNGFWCAGAPTPGAENISACVDPSDDDPPPSGDDDDLPDDESTQEQEPPAAYSDTMPSWAEEPKISTYAGARKRVVVAGASIDLEGQARGVDGEPLQYARYIWSFGDGSREEGKDIMHTYYYPGEYVVVLNTASGGYAAMDRVVVKVIAADIAITNVSFGEPSFIEIHNKTSYELDLSQWQLKAGKRKFTISQDTFIRPKEKIVFPSQVTGLFIKKGDKVSFLYPSGDIVASYRAKENIPAPVNKASNKMQTTQPATQHASDHVEEKIVIKDITLDRSVSHKTAETEDNAVLGSTVAGQDPEEKRSDVSDIKPIAQAANVLSTTRPQKKNKEDGLFWGIMGVSLISLIAIYGVLISKEKQNPIQATDEVGLYKIIEIED